MSTKPKSLGKFILRVPPPLHTRLKHEAQSAGCSLNEYCTQILDSGSAGLRKDDSFARDLVSRAKNILGDALAGVIVYGSWVRGEAGDTSDVDVMLVVDAGVPITRSLVARWDEQPMTYEQRPVETHFVAMPQPGQSVSGLWAELAIDGIIVFERAFGVSRLLAFVRSEIAAGRLRRRRTHGQSYWVHAKDEVA